MSIGKREPSMRISRSRKMSQRWMAAPSSQLFQPQRPGRRRMPRQNLMSNWIQCSLKQNKPPIKRTSQYHSFLKVVKAKNGLREVLNLENKRCRSQRSKWLRLTSQSWRQTWSLAKPTTNTREMKENNRGCLQQGSRSISSRLWGDLSTTRCVLSVVALTWLLSEFPSRIKVKTHLSTPSSPQSLPWPSKTFVVS